MMNNKTRKMAATSIHIDGELVPITDPAHQAAVDRLFELGAAKLSKADRILLANLPSAKKPKARKRK